MKGKVDGENKKTGMYRGKREEGNKGGKGKRRAGEKMTGKVGRRSKEEERKEEGVYRETGREGKKRQKEGISKGRK